MHLKGYENIHKLQEKNTNVVRPKQYSYCSRFLVLCCLFNMSTRSIPAIDTGTNIGLYSGYGLSQWEVMNVTSSLTGWAHIRNYLWVTSEVLLMAPIELGLAAPSHNTYTNFDWSSRSCEILWHLPESSVKSNTQSVNDSNCFKIQYSR